MNLSDMQSIWQEYDSRLEKSINLNKEIQYLELPIFHSSFKEIVIPNRIPVPKIEKLILGHLFKDNFQAVKEKLMTLAKTSLGYEIEIELSRMAKYYYEK